VALLLGLLALSDDGLDALPVEQRAMAAEQLAQIAARRSRSHPLVGESLAASSACAPAV